MDLDQMTQDPRFQQGMMNDQAMAAAKAQKQLSAQYQKLLQKGLSPQEADLVMRGSFGGLEPGEEEAFMSILQRMVGQGRYEARAGMVPGMEESLQSWGGGSKPDKMQIYRDLMGGGGGELRLRELMR